ncbi:hypothetical protein IPJ72_04020 [Candidatus Peregrinibacteria bacterium]|nr:MAG: hypothetical protein IPJ72_04020 [Candidatus Peregrinibacteria bacterium]
MLEKARLDHDLDARRKTLGQLQDIFSKKIPAVFLYRPSYTFALSKEVQNASFENLATISDRFASIASWYAKVDRDLKEGTTPWTFVKWIFSQF